MSKTRPPSALVKIHVMYTKLKNDWNTFVAPLKKECTELVVTQTTNQKIVTIKPNIHNVDALDWVPFDDGTEERHMRDTCYFIERNIQQYGEYVKELLHSYRHIQKKIGNKQLKNDNKELEAMITRTHNQLDQLKNNYVWVV